MLDRRSFLRLIGFAPAAALTKPNPQIIRLPGQRLPFTKSAEPRLASERCAVNCRHWSWNHKPRYANVYFTGQVGVGACLSGLCWRGKDIATCAMEARACASLIQKKYRLIGPHIGAEEDEMQWQVAMAATACHAFETCDYFEEKP